MNRRQRSSSAPPLGAHGRHQSTKTLRVWARPIALVALGVLAVGSPALLSPFGLVQLAATSRASGPLPQEAYVWQRSWGQAVQQALAEAAPRLDGIVALGAEVSWDAGRRQVAHVPLEYAALRQAYEPAEEWEGEAPAEPPSEKDRPPPAAPFQPGRLSARRDRSSAASPAGRGNVGIALRIGPYAGPLAENAEPTNFLADLAHSLVSDAAAAGLALKELQLDFDCAESKLDGYRIWVQAIRKRVAPVPVTITALPSWLNRSAFKRLAAAADGYVLQVHSVEPPAGPDAPWSLCDVSAARRWVERAARLGPPFRVALPTYGYLAAFDERGELLGLSAEGPAVSWPPGARLRDIRADPAAMAELVQGWTKDRPMNLQGVIWYRLPTQEDALNWRWPTLAAVMAGRAPQPAARAEIRRPQPQLVEIELANDGDADLPLGMEVAVHWKDARLVAGDALGGFDWDEAGSQQVRLRATPETGLDRLGPGERRLIAWLRFSRDTEVQVDVSRTQMR